MKQLPSIPSSARTRLQMEEEVARLKVYHDKLKLMRDIAKLETELLDNAK